MISVLTSEPLTQVLFTWRFFIITSLFLDFPSSIAQDDSFKLFRIFDSELLDPDDSMQTAER